MKDFSSLFFNATLSQRLEWNKTSLRIGAVTPSNKAQISAGLRDMSQESIRNRFLGSKRFFSDKELEYLTKLDGENHYAIGVEEREKLKRGVAIIRLVRSLDDLSEAEVAITIIDEYQKMGLGQMLIRLIILAAMERNISKLSFTFLPQNTAIPKLLQKISTPIPGPVSFDSVQLFLDLSKMDAEGIKSQLHPHLEWIDSFHLKT